MSEIPRFGKISLDLVTLHQKSRSPDCSASGTVACLKTFTVSSTDVAISSTIVRARARPESNGNSMKSSRDAARLSPLVITP